MLVWLLASNVSGNAKEALHAVRHFLGELGQGSRRFVVPDGQTNEVDLLVLAWSTAYAQGGLRGVSGGLWQSWAEQERVTFRQTDCDQ